MHATAQVQIPATPASDAAAAVVARLRLAGYSTFWVGGCVRDLLLGRQPKDYDVATAATPKQVTALFAQVVQVGASFGVVRVRWSGPDGVPVEVEVATFRADGPYSDGRRPDSVRFTDAREDVLRRDFTLNGLLLDPLAGPSCGQVVDWVGGLADLDRRVLRAIGEPAQRFGEDALRLLRAPRFAARFGLNVEPATAAAIRALAPTLRIVSVERIHLEVLAMLLGPEPGRALSLLVDLQLAAALWPVLTAWDPALCRAIARAEGLSLLAESHHAGALPACNAVDPMLAVASLAGDAVAWPASQEYAASICLPRLADLAVRRVLTLAHGCPLRDPAPAPWSPVVARWLRDPWADHALVLLAARQPTQPWPQWRALRAAWPLAAAFPALGFDGDDLQRWGYRPGPAFKQALAAAEDVRLAGGDLPAAEQAARAILALNA